MYYRNPIKIMCATRLNDGIFTVHRFFPLRHPLDCANWNVFFDSMYTAEYLTTHWDFCICTWNRLFFFFFVLFFSFVWM
jgi:hypothetical protein